MSQLELDVTVSRPGWTMDVALSVADGEVVAVLGPNGAGKSTLLGVLAGLLRPDAGYVKLGGRLIIDIEANVFVPPHRRGIGLLAQQPLLFPHMSALANVAFGPRAAGSPKAVAETRARELLQSVDVVELADRRPSELSGGQAQRVALARALAPKPELVLLDEPLAALDVDASPALRSLLRRVLRVGRQTSLLVTHDVLDALVLSDRVVVLADGHIVEEGPTREVLTRPRSPFAARVAGLDLIPGMWCAEGLRTPDGVIVVGQRDQPVNGDGPAVAVFPPSAVAVFRDEPHGSPRNVIPVQLAALEPRGDVIRLRAAARDGGPDWVDGLAADVTPAAVADLAAEPGSELWFTVKATEVMIHPASR